MMRFANGTISAFVMRMEPCDTAWPIELGWFVP